MTYDEINNILTIANNDNPRSLSSNISTILESLIETETRVQALIDAPATGDELTKLQSLQNTIQIQKAILKIIHNK